MVDSARRDLAVDRQREVAPYHRDVAVDLDRGGAGELFVIFVLAGFDVGEILFPRQVADDFLAIRARRRDGRAAATRDAKLRADRGGIGRIDPGEPRAQRGHDLLLLARGRGERVGGRELVGRLLRGEGEEEGEEH